MKLGKFGNPHPPMEASFDYFDVPIRVHPDLSDVTVMDLFSTLSGTGNGEKVSTSLRSVATTLVHPEDVDEFWVLVKANRQTATDLGELAVELLAALTGRPTQQPSDSSDGLQPTEESSKDVSSSQALRLLEGRPDLQVAVLRSEEAHRAV